MVVPLRREETQMSTNEQNRIQEKIKATLNSLEAIAIVSRSELRASADVNSNVFQDELDCAKAEMDIKTAVEIHNYNIIQQNLLRAALAKMHCGTFGVCRACGEEISDGRLSALPEATQCIDCQLYCDFKTIPESKFTHRKVRKSLSWAA